MDIIFDKDAQINTDVKKEVQKLISEFKNLDHDVSLPITIFQDGKSGSYYIKCQIPARIFAKLIDLDARLDPSSATSFRANRELLVKHHTYLRMRDDATCGREFNDIIVEYANDYSSANPLKVWGGQHRSLAIREAFDSKGINRNHGFRIYFCLGKEQRTDLALVSNTNIAISNDLFDRQLEETLVGTQLRDWCWRVGLLQQGEDFPDQASKTDKIPVKLARTFIVNFFHGKAKGSCLQASELDKNIYEPYLCQSGAHIDPEYQNIIQEHGQSLWTNSQLEEAGKAFSALHKAQVNATTTSNKIEKRKAFRNKAYIFSVVAGWSYVAGLLQSHTERLQNLYKVPGSGKDFPDPLNAKGMSTFHHNEDPPTYRGLGTRTDMKDRQRMAQVFLAKSNSPNAVLDKALLHQAVSQVIGIKVLLTGYSQF